MIKFLKEKKIRAWCLFDFGISSYPTLILTFFYGAFYAKVIVGDPISGTAYWGFAISSASLFSFLLISFFLIGSKRYSKVISTRFYKLIFYIMIVSISSLVFFKKGSSTVLPLIFVVISYICFEFINLFYNVSLHKISPKNQESVISNLGWAVGYAGGLLALILLYSLIEYSHIFGLKSSYSKFSIFAGPFVAIWCLAFGMPHFFNFKKEKFPIPSVLDLWNLLKDFKLRYFLFGYFFLNNGVVCIFSFASIIAAFVFNLNELEILYLGVFVNLSGIFGCILFSFLGRKLNSVQTVIISLCALFIFSSLLFFTNSVKLFWIISLSIGFFVGPIQASSRAHLAERLDSKNQLTIFSFYSILGNVCSILGPFLVGFISDFFGSIKLGILIIPTFFLVSIILLARFSMFKVSYITKNH